MRYALERGYGRQRAPVRATLAGSVAAVTALAVSVVFSSSLSGLVSHPARYGWNWATLIQSQAGWGSWSPDSMTSIIAHQHGIIGWSEFGFGQLAIDHQEIPVLGLLQHGANAPPTTSGHPLAAADQIELGAVTMRALGLKVGDKVTVGAARRPFTVVGTVTLPSMGTVLTDHVSLGRGAMMEEDAMLAADHLEPYTQAVFAAANANDVAVSSPFYPSAVAIYARSGADARQAAASILRHEPDGTPGGMYTLPPQPAAQIVNFQQMGGLPLTIALGVATAAVLALALTIVASVRQRRRELALLKSLGCAAASSVPLYSARPPPSWWWLSSSAFPWESQQAGGHGRPSPAPSASYPLPWYPPRRSPLACWHCWRPATYWPPGPPSSPPGPR